jgi:glycosyltransferase involved in cell wall biosynthesis
MGISQAMADEYESRYGRPFSVFGNSVDESGFAAAGSARPASVPDDSPSHPVRLVYVGGLHLDRWQPLIDIASALGSVDPRARLVIHAPDADLETFGDVLTACPGVQLAGSVSSDQVPGILAAADILVHIESFDDAHRRYTRLSLSTKIPQYMAAGRAILAYGPGEVASMKHIEAVRAGVVVGQEDPQALAAAVTKLTTDAAARNELGNNGYWFARRHHAKDLVAARFVDFLRSAGQPRQTAQPTGPDQRASS